MSEVSARRRSARRWMLAPLALLGPGLVYGCDGGDAVTAPVSSVVSAPQPSSPSPRATDVLLSPDAPSAEEGGGGEARPPLEATLDPSATNAVASPDAGPSESTDAGAGDAGVADAGPPPSNDCCQTSPAGGCSDATVAACVCEGDPFCCSTEYDGSCVTEATSRCGLDCDDRAPTSDCCTVSDVPGCTLPDVEACICDIDPVCCVFRFDQNCINIGTSRCAAACGAAERGP